MTRPEVWQTSCGISCITYRKSIIIVCTNRIMWSPFDATFMPFDVTCIPYDMTFMPFDVICIPFDTKCISFDVTNVYRLK